MLELIENVFLHLGSADLRAARLVSTCWLGLVDQLIKHTELGYLHQRWLKGEPKVDKMQV